MDIDYLLMLQNFRDATGGVLDGFFELVTKLGEASIVTLLVAAMYWCVDKREGIFLMLTFYYNRVINAFVKITACVYRPWILDARVTPVEGAMADATGYSFPSGHSANAASFFGGLTLKKRQEHYHKNNTYRGGIAYQLFPQLPRRTYSAGRYSVAGVGGGIAVRIQVSSGLGG